MNIYQKGGFFKSHVDTPKGGNMIGSLVICLPCPHKGGALEVIQVPFYYSLEKLKREEKKNNILKNRRTKKTRREVRKSKKNKSKRK